MKKVAQKTLSAPYSAKRERERERVSAKMKKAILPSLVAVFALAETTSGAEQIQTFASETQEIQAFASEAQEIQSYELEETLVEAHAHDTQKYSSGASLGKSQLDSTPSGNGDIGSALKVLPNVQYDNTQSRSTTPGEIDPANVSISGGLHYQNNFQIDGFNMNNDLTSNISSSHSFNDGRGQASQGLNIDTSLLESITVQDSNIGAAYGGFTGGVVEANVRRATKDGKWHANLSFQYTADEWTKYHIDERMEDDFYEAPLSTGNSYFQPDFTKFIFRSSLEGYITDKWGILGSFTTTQSYIPVQGYSNIIGVGGSEKRTQKRQAYNFYLKTHYEVSENLLLEGNLGYVPQYNTYFLNTAANSNYRQISGGLQGGFKAIYSNKLGIWTNLLSYSGLQSSRYSDVSYYASWYYSPDKNWSYTNTNGNQRVYEGYDGDLYHKSHTTTYKSDFAFEPVKAWISTHTFGVGLELSYTYAFKERPTGYANYSNNFNSNGYPMPLLPTTPGFTGACPDYPDSLGNYSCSNGKPYQKPTTWTDQDYADAVGQWQSRIPFYRAAGTISIHNFAYAAYLQDDINFDLGKFGEINARPGLRFEGDDYMKQTNLAPRFAINYITPAPQSYQTKITLGANRYYARNLYSYEMLNFPSYDAARTLTRNSPYEAWQETPSTGASPSTVFRKLKVPYDDELMAGLSQNLGFLNADLKYIYREGKREITRANNQTIGVNVIDPNIDNSYSTWSNEGRSYRHILSFSLENSAPIETFGISHHYLFAFDYTKVKRGHQIEATNTDNNAFLNSTIIYDGRLIKYNDRPVDNYARPYTLRLSTTHTAKFWRTKWLFNNFFRYRSPYERMVTVTTNANNIARDYAALFQNADIAGVYAKKKFAGAFTWDMRVGFEIDVHKGNTFYTNVDIINVLNKANQTAISNSSGNVGDGIAGSAYTYSVYEVGRQFWLQVGYKY